MRFNVVLLLSAAKEVLKVCFLYANNANSALDNKFHCSEAANNK